MDLRYFINQCEAANELKRVAAEVDWNLEISHVSKLTEEKKGPALLFENIKGYSSPVFTGAFATTKRLAIMLGLPHHLTMCESARAWMKKTITSEGLIKANEVKDGPVLENIISGDKVDLNMFPVPKFFPLDGGRYIGTMVFWCCATRKPARRIWAPTACRCSTTRPAACRSCRASAASAS